jgi:hypothetical protein
MGDELGACRDGVEHRGLAVAERPGGLHEVGPHRHPAPQRRPVTPDSQDRMHAAVGDWDQRQPAGGELRQPPW